VTVTGCIYQGVECLILKNLKGKQDYSLVRSNNLQIGHSYQITGPVSDIGTCQEGKPILSAQLVHELRLQCKPPADRKNGDFAVPPGRTVPPPPPGAPREYSNFMVIPAPCW
jgi:hypothetical protein